MIIYLYYFFSYFSNNYKAYLEFIISLVSTTLKKVTYYP